MLQSIGRPRWVTRSLAGVVSALALVAGMVLVAPPAHAAPVVGPDKIAPELARAFESESSVDFWVRFGDRASFTQAQRASSWVAQGTAVADELQATATASQERVVDLLSEQSVEFEEFWITNAVYVHGGSQSLAAEMAARPEVSGVYLPVEYQLVKPTEVDPDVEVQAIEWGIDNIQANDVWDQFGVRGQGITVASIDTGVQFDHPALAGTYRGNLGGGDFDHNYNWFDAAGACPGGAPCDTDTDFGHGTHTMGTMVGDDGAGNQIGVAPEATWITTNGCCPSSAALIASGQWLLEPTDLNGENPDASKRPNIINNSWGTTVPSNDPFMEDVIEAWDQAGIMSIWANGNNGPNCNTSGAPGSRVITYSVGNYDINNQIATLSSRGSGQNGETKPNISAPGSNVRSANPGNSYRNLSGTSMAAPHVTGAVALLWSAAPGLVGDIGTTRQLLDQTAIDTEDAQCGGTAEDNNVYGEGRLDALALLQAAPIGDAGTLAGTITEDGSGDPIAGAEVTLSGPVDRTVATGADGGYEVLVPPGDYAVTADAFGYEPGSVQATVVAGETTTADFTLAALDSVTVSGTVSDGSGHGWPMYTRIGVEGSPVSTYTDPVTGAYSLDLPVGVTYTLTFAPQLPGYAAAAEVVEATGGDIVLDVSLLVDECPAAPGYGYAEGGKIAKITTSPTQGFDDFFAANGIPVDFYDGSDIDVLADQISEYGAVVWGYNSGTAGTPTQEEMDTFLAATDAAGIGVIFLDHAFTTWNGVRALSNLTGNPTGTGSSSGGTGQQSLYEVTQEHPVLAGHAVGDQILHEPAESAWLAWFDGYEGEGRQVIASAGRTGDGILGSGIGVQERASNRHVLLSIHSASATRSPAGWSPESEQIFWNALDWVAPDADFPPDCAPGEGGLVVGHVTDQNTGEGINGATVALDADPEVSTTTFATSDDPNLDDGFFWLFSPLTGSQDVTASSGAYQPDTVTADVASSGATAASFTLGAGRLAVEPAGVDSTVRLGRSAEDTFTVTNTGTAPVEVTLSERRGGFEILNTDGSTSPFSPLALAGRGAEVQRIDAEVSFAAAPAGGFGTQGAPAPAPAQDAWEDLPTMPLGTMDNNVVLVDGAVYSIGGTDGTISFSDVLRYDIGAGTWEQLADAPRAMQASAHGVIDGLVYLAGGFGDGLDGSTYIFDPSTGEWTAGSAAPAGRAAAGSAVLDGQLYLVGGCTTGSCTPFATDVFRYDPGADSWETLAPYPEPAAFLSCGGVSGVVACAGGTDDAGALTSTYVFDPATGEWTAGADLPADMWASGYTGANGRLLVSGGVVGGSISNEGYAYDPLANTWETLPAANHALYRGGGACGFYRVGGSVSQFNETDLAEVLPGFEDCGVATDVPWLAADPTSATLAPGDSLTVTVSMDSADVDQPGAYTGGVGIGHNTPYAVPPVDVTMNVTPPNAWGKITGTVAGVDCEGGEAPLSGAIVQINGKREQLTLRTDAAGGYGWWMPVRNNALQLVVATGSHVPEVRTSLLVPRQATVEDFALQQIC